MSSSDHCELLGSSDPAIVCCTKLRQQIDKCIEKIDANFALMQTLADAHRIDLNSIKRGFKDEYYKITNFSVTHSHCHMLDHETFECTAGDIPIKGFCNGVTITLESADRIPFDLDEFKMEFVDNNAYYQFAMLTDSGTKLAKSITIIVALLPKAYDEVIRYTITHCGKLIHVGKFMTNQDYVPKEMTEKEFSFYVQTFPSLLSKAKYECITKFTYSMVENMKIFQFLSQMYKIKDAQLVNLLSEMRKTCSRSSDKTWEMCCTSHLEDCREKLYIMNKAYEEVIVTSTLHRKM